MGRYVLRRLVLALPVLLGVSVAVFLMIELVPGDPATVLAGDTASADQVERIRHDLGLDQPLPVQYLRFLERLAHGSLGESTRTHREVLLEIADRFPYTLALALGAVTLSTVVGVSLGIFAAVNRGRAGDHVTMGIAIVGLQFGAPLGGAFIIENIFGWPGVGRLAVQAIFNRDFPVVQGTVLLVAVAYLLSNLVVDVVYAWLDPRIRYG